MNELRTYDENGGSPATGGGLLLEMGIFRHDIYI